MALDFLQFAGQINQSVFTFSSQNLGVADADRYILCAIGGRAANTTQDLSTLTIGGVSASVVLKNRILPNGNSMNIGAFYVAHVPTGTTGNVVATFTGGSMETCGIALYRLVDINLTPFDTETFGANSPTPNVSIDAPPNGIVLTVAFGGAGTNPTGETWTGATEEYGSNINAHRMSGARNDFPSGVTGQTITCTWSPGSAWTAMAAISLEEILAAPTDAWWAF